MEEKIKKLIDGLDHWQDQLYKQANETMKRLHSLDKETEDPRLIDGLRREIVRHEAQADILGDVKYNLKDLLE